MTAPRRRWSFSLRTLFMTVGLLGMALGWAAYQRSWIRARHEFMAAAAAVQETEHGSFIAMWSDDPFWAIHSPGFISPATPISLRPFGERAVALVVIGRDQPLLMARAMRLFPEAHFSDTWTVMPEYDNTSEGLPAIQADRP